MILEEDLLLLTDLSNEKIFIFNDYFIKYIDLIKNNTNTPRKIYKTQKHHIVPKSYFKLNQIPVDNSCNNIVNLYYQDHILAHYYLSLCTIGRFKYNNIAALQHIIGMKNKIKEYEQFDFNLENLNHLQELYEERSLIHSQIMKGRLCGDKNPSKRPEVRSKISLAKRNHEVSESTRLKLHDANFGSKRTHRPVYSEQGKLNQINSKLGDKNPAKRLDVRLINSIKHQNIIRITNNIDNYIINKDDLDI